VTLAREGDEVRLVVQDDGPGYPDLRSVPRSSGLALIRGLCRQIGGALELDNARGARSTVTFTDAGTAAEPGGAGSEIRAVAYPAST
jgi:two-component sensor histidine kinase